MKNVLVTKSGQPENETSSNGIWGEFSLPQRFGVEQAAIDKDISAVTQSDQACPLTDKRSSTPVAATRKAAYPNRASPPQLTYPPARQVPNRRHKLSLGVAMCAVFACFKRLAVKTEEVNVPRSKAAFRKAMEGSER